MSEKLKLKRCPFCGDPGHVFQLKNEFPFVGCGGGPWGANCDMRGPSAGSVEAAIAAWNRRATLPQEPEE